MKIIEHSYGTNLDWVEHYAKQLDGKVEGNFIVAPDNGTRYILQCGEGIVAYYLDVVYNKNYHLIQKNNTNDFVGFYYNLTDGEASVTKKTNIYNVNRWHFNLSVIDSSLITQYHVTPGSKTFALCIFINKSIIETFAKKNNFFIKNIDQITDPTKNTIIRFDRMSNESYHILEDLHKLQVGGRIFDLNLAGTVHLLIANFLKKISSKRIIIQTVNESDLENIITIQKFLVDNLNSPFPSIKIMSNMSNMSESKFKNLFKKITGLTPNSFFMDNKLIHARELLETGQLSISQVSDQLQFTNNSYFASKFKEHFGISPKTYIKQL